MATQADIDHDWDLVAALAADLHDAHARLVDLVSHALTEGSWQAAGIRSPEHWLTIRAGLSRGQAAAVVLLARRQTDLPATATALREGRISLDQAAVVARHTPPAFDETVAEFAQHATVTQLQRTVTRYDFTLEQASHDDDGHPLPAEKAPTPPDPEAPTRPEDLPEPVAPPSLTMGTDETGRFRLRYDAPPEIGALVETALAEARDHLFQLFNGTTGKGTADEPDTPDEPGGPRAYDPGGPRITWADALAHLATRSLAAAPNPGRRSRYRVQVHLDTDGGWLTGRPRLPRHIVEGLTCDGTLTPVWETAGHPVNVGTTHRTVPQRTRVLVLDRDRGCRFPGCGATAYVEVHHLRHWSKGGPTDLPNLLALCPFHHDGHHRGEYTISGDPTRADGLAFHTHHGLPIGPPAPPRPPTRRDAAVQSVPSRPRPRLGRHYPAPTGGTLHLHLVDFTPT